MTMLVAASSSSSSSSSYVLNLCKYDVFISFRGETRKNFTSHLYDALCQSQIETYIDEEGLKRGEEISPALLRAIEESKISIIIFSKDYGSSRWCLDELVHIVKCKTEKGQIVLPVFYDVDPSDIRKQRGTYGDAFAEHEKRFDLDKVKEWRDALTAAANLSGFPLGDQSEAKFVKEIVEKVLENLHVIWSSYVADDFEGLVGMEKRLKKIESLLCVGSLDVRVVGIWGMGGIGKTTIAEVVYKRLSPEFESCYFTDVKEDVSKYGLRHLNEKLVSKLLKPKSLDREGFSKHVQLRRKKVLVVLDNVDELEQLECLVGEHDALARGSPQRTGRFGVGSRIIVTSRDKKLLRRKADEIYEVDALDSTEARELFYMKAFERDSAVADYFKLAERVLDYAKGNPLAIKVLGSYLHSRTTKEWESALRELTKAPNKKIQKVLKISYDALDPVKQSVFLDIACFFKGKDRDFVEGILEGESHVGINVLIERSLITVKEHALWMHDLIQEMGQEIVRQESVEELGKRSRLWRADDVYYVLNNNKGTAKSEGIFLDISEIQEDLCLTPTVFQEMCNLRLLKIYNSGREKFKIYLHQAGLQYLPHSLRYLSWCSYPSKSLPTNFKPQYLVELNMRHSNLKKLWDGVQPLGSLRHIDFGFSEELVKVPDLSQASKLESINLQYCESLIELPSLNLQVFGESHQGVDEYDSSRALGSVNLSGCTSLKILPDLSGNITILQLQHTAIEELPSSIGSLENLSVLDLFDCKCLKNLPVLPRNVNHLNMRETAIKEVPSTSIECLHGLEIFNMGGCKDLESLPPIFYKFKSLKALDLSGCSKLKNFPEILETMEHLEYLDLSGTDIQELPSSIENAVALRSLFLKHCQNLKAFPESLNNLNSREHLSLDQGCSESLYLDLRHCNILTIPEWLGSLSSLTQLNLSGNTFDRIPSSVRQLHHLHWLDISHCKNLHFLPELPCSIQYLNARGCISIEAVTNSGSALTLGCWDSKPPFEGSFIFFECLKLDQSSCSNIVFDFLCRVICTATIPALAMGRKAYDPFVGLCYPGSKIPKWFNHQSEGSSITIKLPQNWHRASFSGFVLCVVLAFEDPNCFQEVYRLDIENELHIKTSSGRSHNCGNIGYWSFLNGSLRGKEGAEEEREILRLGHVFMQYSWYDSNNFIEMCGDYSDAVEMSFEFSCNYLDEERDEFSFDFELIKRCGVRMLYIEEEVIKEFKISIDQYVEYQLEAEELGISTRQYINQYIQQPEDYSVTSLSLSVVSDSHAIGLTQANSDNQVSNVVVDLQGFQLKTIEAYSQNLPTFYDFFSMEAPSDHDMDTASPSRDSMVSDERIFLNLSLSIGTTGPSQEVVVEQRADTGNDWANNVVAVVEEQLLQSHVSAFEELNSIMVNEPVPSVNQVIQSCADESCVSDSVRNEARIATDEVVEQSLDAEVNQEFQLMATGSFSETLSGPHDCLSGTELERPSAASGNSNYEDNDDHVESVVLEGSDTIANEPVPSGTETINYDAADQHMERTTCFDFCRCFPFLSIVIDSFSTSHLLCLVRGLQFYFSNNSVFRFLSFYVLLFLFHKNSG